MGEDERRFKLYQHAEMRQYQEQEALISELQDLLERQQPLGFNHRWIKRENPTLFWRFQANNGGPLNAEQWSAVVNKLNSQWSDRWDKKNAVAIESAKR